MKLFLSVLFFLFLGMVQENSIREGAIGFAKAEFFARIFWPIWSAFGCLAFYVLGMFVEETRKNSPKSVSER